MGRKYRDIVRSGSRAKRSARAVMNTLADYADDTGEAWPGHERIADETGLSERTVTRAITELIELGELEIAIRCRYHDHPRYRILVKEGRQPVYSKEEQGRQIDGEGRQPVYNRVDNLSNRVDNLSRVYIEEPHEPQIEPQEEPDISSAPPKTAPRTAQTMTAQQDFFQSICDAIGWDYKTLTKEATGRVAQTIGVLQKASYTAEDVRRFMTDIWYEDFRWIEKKGQRPTLNVLRNEIGKIRVAIPVDMPIPQSATSQLIDDVLAGRVR